MLGNAFSGWHLVIILFIVLLLFGAPKLPGLARSLGQSMKIFKTEIKGDKGDDTADGNPKTDGPVDPAAKP
ncbi:Sec-independent protein translocase subunit TatA [Cryobacterium roopkundense]|uniref:Sec-independent protein translocase protein TatA n=1 Tax=Cryobacterium roopkundense TaxID=1001240 RepID=A0A7W9E3I4_9MICO|nr:Sec-independent protein translocase subunit TatA [Cryobacterium roopkundense]MBB5641213.1 sec-independent protein translocase protein TatA [Cryobacterium roopkundense]